MQKSRLLPIAFALQVMHNALRIAEKMSGGSPIIFGLDRGLSYYVSRRTTKEIITIPEYGYCPVHHQIALEDLLKTKKEHP